MGPARRGITRAVGWARPFAREISLDPLTHSFVGASLSAAGLRRATPLATAALVLGANAPDIDIVAHMFGPYSGLALRRGITHGVPALVVLPFAVVTVLIAWDRRVRKKTKSDAGPARPLPLLGLATIGVLTHPVLDWLNTYGMRWWLPFSGTWSYGDSVFIVDPWLWLLLGGGLFVVNSASRVSRLAWAGLAVVLTLLVLGADFVPTIAKLLWTAALVGWILLRTRGMPRVEPSTEAPSAMGPPRHPCPGKRVVRWTVALAALYIVAMVGQSGRAERITLAEANERGIGTVDDLMVGPVPANPFKSEVVLRLPDGYRRGTFSWLSTPRLRLDPGLLPHHPRGDVVRSAEEHPDARNFLVWSRFPLVSVEGDEENGWTVEFRDVRYLERGALTGPTVAVPPMRPSTRP